MARDKSAPSPPKSSPLPAGDPLNRYYVKQEEAPHLTLSKVESGSESPSPESIRTLESNRLFPDLESTRIFSDLSSCSESPSTIINRSALNCVELFCGKAEVSRAFKIRGHNTFSTDKRKRDGKCIPDLRIPMEKLRRRNVPFDHIHFLWASVPCTAFSYGAGDYYYDGKYAKQNAALFIKLLKITLDFIEESTPDFFFIENPRGKLRYEKMMVDWCVKHAAVIKEITLGSYGFPTIKPTDIFTNAYDWQPRKKLPYGRGAKNTIAVLTNLTQVQRQATPVQLAEELCSYIEGKYYPGLSFHSYKTPSI
jgi:hypothetical protein